MRILKFCSRLIAFLSGVYYYKYKKINVDYTKYLGPDWTPTNRKPSTYLANHSVWLDIFMLWVIKDYPIFAAKSAVKKFPIVGYLASYKGYSTIFVNRGGTKEERSEMIKIMG